MHHSIQRLDADEIVGMWSGRPLPSFAPPVTPRGEHAHFLEIAAARRRRAMDRAALNRFEDADYWKAVAPAALARARVVRATTGFSPLP
jgi:hypothetical protein